jgi:hypothetical protein
MTKQGIEDGSAARALAPFEAHAHEPSDDGAARARPIPRISIDAFCEDAATADVVQI